MKKIILIALAIIALGFSSCKKQETNTGYYYYTNSRHFTDGTGMPENNITELDNYLVSNKFNKVFNLTKEEAKAEWKSFLTDVEAMTIFVNDASYYEVSFDRYESQGNSQEMRPAENIGKKRWGKGN